MPEKTLNALADHGNGAPSIKGTYEESHAIMNKLADLGINIKDVTDKLEADGVAAFIKSGTPSSPTSGWHRPRQRLNHSLIQHR